MILSPVHPLTEVWLGCPPKLLRVVPTKDLLGGQTLTGSISAFQLGMGPDSVSGCVQSLGIFLGGVYNLLGFIYN